MKARLILFALLAALIPGAFWCGIHWQLGSERAVAEDHARLIAVAWEEGMSIDDMCKAARELGEASILREQWQAGEGNDIALGPVVSGKRICIRRDKDRYWRAAR